MKLSREEIISSYRLRGYQFGNDVRVIIAAPYGTAIDPDLVKLAVSHDHKKIYANMPEQIHPEETP